MSVNNCSFTVCGSSSDIDDKMMEQPSATASTLTTDDLQADSDQWSLDLAPLLYPNDELSEVGSSQACDGVCDCPSTDSEYNMADDDANTTGSTAEDDPSQTARPRIVSAISRLRDQYLTATTTLTSAEFRVLDELTEELLVTVLKKSLDVPPVSLCLNDDERSSRDDDSILSPVPWVMVPTVLDRLLEFDEVSSEIKNADTTYGNHLPPLPSCLVSAPDLETRLCKSPAAIDII